MKNKELTKTKILNAFEHILVDEGFQKLKIRHIASLAKVDKVLIYRYFGGLEGLAAAYAESTEFWPSLEESLGNLTTEDFKTHPQESVKSLIRQHIRAIRSRKSTAAVLAWELVENSPVCRVLSETREKHALSLYDFLVSTGLFELQFLNSFGAILGATLNYLIVKSNNDSVFSGIPIQSEEGWQQLEEVFVTLALQQITLAEKRPENSQQ